MVPESPTDSGAWRWIVVLGAFFSHFITCGFEKGYSIIYVEIIRVYGTSAAVTSALGGTASAVRLLLAPLAVSLSNIYSEQRVVMAGGILTFLGLLLASLSDHFVFVFIGYGVIFGLGLTLTFTPSLIICTYYFHERRATALSLSLAGCGFATMVLPYFFYYLISQYGLSGALLILSAFSLHYCIAGALYFKKDFLGKTVESNSNPEKIKSTLRSRVMKYLHKLLNVKIASGIWVKLFLFSFILNMIGSGPVTTLLIDYSNQLGVIGSQSVQLLVIEGTVQLVMRIALGFVFDYPIIKPHRGIIWTGGIAFSSIIIILIAFASQLKFLSALMFLRGVFLALYISQQAVVLSDLCEGQPETTSQTIAIAQICKGLGTLIGSFLSGLIKDYTEDYRPAFIFLGVMQFIGFITSFTSIIWARINSQKHKNHDVVENLISSSNMNISEISLSQSELNEDVISNDNKQPISSSSSPIHNENNNKYIRQNPTV
ncbi:Monocarboxylate transporter 13 [Schistosoma japonicum]|nr:Monocarboxylate transporter 13 [Schistosoma japonicum]KAH8872843.1 Monocarboxylate transporter 13 [Schistosoma japonicum]KAH8872847.1 Monocarboxylate transporter 13 [Schistosoma japonicum]